MEQTKETIFLEESIEIKETIYGGRGVFAKKNIPLGTIILRTEFISLIVILREYRREVCAHCFAYNLGKNLPIRIAEVNFSFCSSHCQKVWIAATGPLGLEAWKTLEDFIRSKAGKSTKGIVDGSTEPTDENGDISMGDYPRRPDPTEIEHVWASVHETASHIRQHRQGHTTKRTRKALTTALSIAAHPDSLSFLLSGMLAHHAHLHQPDSATANAWPALTALAAASAAYQSAFHLRNQAHSYLHLLASMPAALLASITPAVCRATAAHDAHNAFGIRSLDDAGAEFFGWGVWPHASLFNHACGYNVNKMRLGSTWTFAAGRDVTAGEELTITYLGGDEREMALRERGERTESIWGFVCACGVCEEERGVLVGENGDGNDRDCEKAEADG